MPAPIEVRYAQGIFVPEADLWLDPPRRRPRAFVSHAHSDHFARHEWTLCSPPTAQLIIRRYGVPRARILAPQPFHQPLDWNGFSICLLPAGHILGSAMLHLTRLADGATLLYTGDFKLRHGLTAEPAVLQHADTLVMETTFGRPEFVFPPLEETVARMHHFVRETLSACETPALLGYSLGKAQEILAALAGCTGPIMVHPTILELAETYHACGYSFPKHRVFEPTDAAGHALVLPPKSRQHYASIPKLRTVMLSGWALTKGAKYRYGVDELLPLSDHADYHELLECVAQVAPTRIFTVHGYTTNFARDLRQRGHEAWSLVKDEQMELPLTNSAQP
ncbi:MAG: MBL fold metallo-hydrolase RNA specificity domain-containing protein [Roseimicrobium sp.]